MSPVRDPPAYTGRFAPSPTGDLHIGSLIAAVASYLQAKSLDGRWLVRIEDIDPPREVEGSAKRILGDLERLGMQPDQPVLYQSTHIQQFRDACETLLQSGLAFPCACSRKTLPANGIYPGTCRHGMAPDAKSHSVRIKTTNQAIRFHDGLQGHIRENLAMSTGDFVIWRADDLPAYQLAVVLDDALQGISEVVRGADLLESTARQIHIQRTLKLPSPAYTHLPVACLGGQKLAKRLHSDPVRSRKPTDAIHWVLRFLGHQAPDQLSLHELWAWAVENWDIQKVPARKSIEVDEVSSY